MSKKPDKPLKIAPLQYIIAEPITDPAELAAIDKARQLRKRKNGGQKAKRNRKDTGTDSSSTAKHEP
jgi:hypothetical protein